MLFTFLCCNSQVIAVSARIDWYNGDGTKLLDSMGEPLLDSLLLERRGDLIELGVYNQATTSDPFAGEWIPFDQGQVGGKDAVDLGPGRFNYSTQTSELEILGEKPFAIRFYDAPTTDSATFFNSVSNVTGAWNAIRPATSPFTITLDLTASSLVWQDGSSSAFRTTIPIPEPAGLAMAAGIAFFLSSRRRHHPNGFVGQ